MLLYGYAIIKGSAKANGSFRKIYNFKTPHINAVSTQYLVFKLLILTQNDTTSASQGCSSCGVHTADSGGRTFQA